MCSATTPLVSHAGQRRPDEALVHVINGRCLSALQVLREVVHLLHSVAVTECSSLMDSQSLAVVMTPNLMPTQHSDPALLDAALKTNTGQLSLHDVYNMNMNMNMLYIHVYRYSAAAD